MQGRSFRLWALFWPSLLVALITMNVRDRMIYTAGQILVAMWIASLGALLVLALDARRQRVPVLERIDVLTSTGAALIATGAGALVLAAGVGWASLSLIGVLGVGTVNVAVIWSALAASSDLAWKRASIVRAIVPERAVEGEPLREEIRLTGVHIAPGMRLFITGRAMRHGAVSRYAVDSRSSGADLRLESDLGPALRGEHQAGPLELWLSDVLGITRTAVVRRGELTFTVLPKPLAVRGARELLGDGGDAPDSQPAQVLPTEGSFRIREYIDGDDTRRIHWMRSLQQNRLVVRLPDEIPPADPEIRLLLDNELGCIDTLSCSAPAEMLDALVRVWLGIGKALAQSGTRVTLVAPLAHGDTARAVERTVSARGPHTTAVDLGARIAWQSGMSLSSLVERRRERQVVVSCRPHRIEREALVSWVVVPEGPWTSLPMDLQRDPQITYAYPFGSPENRESRRTDAVTKTLARWHDRSVFSQIVCWTDWKRLAGDHVALPSSDGTSAVLEVIP
jgi:uncharacterized protein (DUF58 family)